MLGFIADRAFIAVAGLALIIGIAVAHGLKLALHDGNRIIRVAGWIEAVGTPLAGGWFLWRLVSG